VRQRAVDQRLFQRFIAVFIFHVLSDDADPHHIFRVVNAVHQILPLRKIAVFRFQFQSPQHQRIHFFMREYDRHFVDEATSFAVITASSSTLQNSAIFDLMSFDKKRSVRHSKMSG